jgi:hypothetical protein
MDHREREKSTTLRKRWHLNHQIGGKIRLERVQGPEARQYFAGTDTCMYTTAVQSHSHVIVLNSTERGVYLKVITLEEQFEILWETHQRSGDQNPDQGNVQHAV